jgi:hypothetical protein
LATNVKLLREFSRMVQTTEVSNKKPNLERTAKCGMNNHHTSTPILHRENQRLDLLLTSVETQVATELFGAIPMIQRRDGKNVFQGRLVLQLRLN